MNVTIHNTPVPPPPPPTFSLECSAEEVQFLRALLGVTSTVDVHAVFGVNGMKMWSNLANAMERAGIQPIIIVPNCSGGAIYLKKAAE